MSTRPRALLVLAAVTVLAVAACSGSGSDSSDETTTTAAPGSTAVTWGTVLSIPYALDELVPLLASAYET